MHDEGHAGDASPGGHLRLLALTPSSLRDVGEACTEDTDDDDDAYQNYFSNILPLPSSRHPTDRCSRQGAGVPNLGMSGGRRGRCAHTGGMPARPKDNWQGINKGIQALFFP